MAMPTSAMMAVNPLKRKRETHRRSRIEVRIPAKLPEYIARTGPPLQPISLLPPQDSTAYILERILLPSPGLASDGKPLPRRMSYMVGWHDLRAAYLLVPAMQVLDYVSPQAFEEWEYQMEQKLDEERQRVEEKRQRMEKEMMEQDRRQETPKPMRRRGRPPARAQIETAKVAAPRNNLVKTSRPTAGAMSTTPTKARLRELEELSFDDSSPSRQLEEEHLESMNAEDGLDDVDMVSYQPDLKDSTDTVQRDLANKSTLQPHAPEATDAQGHRNVPLGQLVGAPTTKITAQYPAKMPAPLTLPVLESTTRRKETPVPLPRMPAIYQAQTTSSPIQRQSSFKPLGGMKTPTSSQLRKPDSATSSAATLPSQSRPNLKVSAKKSTKPTKKPAQPVSTEEANGAGPEATPEPVWEVKRVEAAEFFEVDGVGLVRYFQVVWEGDWPPEQNPSWEPESNLPPDLVRAFLNKAKKKPAPQRKKVLKQSTLSWSAGKKYKSVSEAFAGGNEAEDLIDHLAEDLDTAVAPNEEDSEELFVVEERPAKESRGRGTVPWKGKNNGFSNGTGTEFGAFPTYH
ncbi:hypothetical protein B0J13DRAFT_287769 [Dactylonectria estremocensis]|uniref:Chromo domain-containing protein n=1 Tax=Dactylonectria estremocensis TaxID=1079267 RepID=A0A9P9J6R8_9HYPO|nr:hypothetical protein B0J13DRAFT_287769 [Dactylonectria estremocensis]